MAKAKAAKPLIDRASTFGATVYINFGSTGEAVPFRAGGSLRYEYDPGYSAVNGEIEFSDGTNAWAVFVICEADRGEVWDYGIFYSVAGVVRIDFASDFKPKIPAWQLAMYRKCGCFTGPLRPRREWEQFWKDATGKSRAELGAMRYKLNAPLAIDDFHRGPTGWSDASIEETRIAAAEKLPDIIRQYDSLHELSGRPSDGAPMPQAPVEAVYLGDRKVQVGRLPPIVLTEAQDSVLCALVELGGSASKDQLADRSGKSDAPRVLSHIREGYPDLAPFIFLPGAKAKGGYRTTVRRRC